jgi:hypothetical protein
VAYLHKNINKAILKSLTRAPGISVVEESGLFVKTGLLPIYTSFYRRAVHHQTPEAWDLIKGIGSR